MTVTEMLVHMDCAGCETKIRKAIQKLDGVHDIDINVDMQKVTVMGWADQEKVLKAVRRTGRRAELWPYPYNPEYNNSNTQNYNRDQHQTIPYTYFATDRKSRTSSYNYHKHGYDDEYYGYYQRPLYSTIVDEQASAMFSDENPHACSIM